MKDIVSEKDSNSVYLTLNKEIYSSEAVMETARKFTDKCCLFIEPTSDGLLCVYFTKSQESDIAVLKNIALDFCNELIEQQLRVKLEARFGNMRELIVKQAFLPIVHLKSSLAL